MPPRILVVDDEPDLELLIRQRFRREIRDGGFAFDFAGNGRDALDAVRTGGIDLVLTDIAMPVMDGLTLLGELRGVRPRLGCVVVSAYGDLPNIRAAMNLGALDFLTKPIDFVDFEATVGKTLRQVGEMRRAEEDRERIVVAERDLHTAAEIQRSLLPPSPLTFGPRGEVTAHAAMAPARAVGGDFYDFFALDDGRLAFAVGDVSGKGVPAALFMAVARTLLRAAARHDADPSKCLALLNAQLLQEATPGMFVTVCYGVLRAATGELQYALGGHPRPFVLRGDGPHELPGRGLMVGAFEEAAWETRRTVLAPGEGLFLYTDGITEATAPAGEMVGADGLAAMLRGCADPGRIVEHVLAAVRRFVGNAPQGDDLTALALSYGAREGDA